MWGWAARWGDCASAGRALVGVLVARVAEADARDGGILELDGQAIADGVGVVGGERGLLVRVFERLLLRAARHTQSMVGSADRGHHASALCACSLPGGDGLALVGVASVALLHRGVRRRNDLTILLAHPPRGSRARLESRHGTTDRVSFSLVVSSPFILPVEAPRTMSLSRPLPPRPSHRLHGAASIQLLALRLRIRKSFVMLCPENWLTCCR